MLSTRVEIVLCVNINNFKLEMDVTKVQELCYIKTNILQYPGIYLCPVMCN